MGWTIIEDKVSDNNSRIGISRGNLVGHTYTAKIFDDDGEHYYTVLFDKQAYMMDDDSPSSLYESLKYAEIDAGATDLRIKLTDLAKMLGLDSREYIIFRDKIARKDGWCSVYG